MNLLMVITNDILLFRAKPNLGFSYIKNSFEGIQGNAEFLCIPRPVELAPRPPPDARQGRLARRPPPDAREGGLARKPPPDAREGGLARKPPPDARELAGVGRVFAGEEIRPMLASSPQILRFPTLRALSGIENQRFWEVFQSIGQ